MAVYILFDIGGTKTRVAVSEDLLTFRVKKFDTPPKYEEGIVAIKEAVGALAPQQKYLGIAGGVRGALNAREDAIATDTILEDWVGKPLSRDLDHAFGAPVILRNDAAMAALGEAHFGAGRGYPIVAYHTVSTGVGGARVISGALSPSAGSFEPGHQILDIDHSLPITGHPYMLEDLVSGTALEARRGVKPYDIPQDDPIWDELARYLAHGLVNTLAYWSPDVIVLGGSMIVGNPRILKEDIIRHTTELLGNTRKCPPIVDATLTDEAGLYGAMAIISQKQGGRPPMKRRWTKGPFRWIDDFVKKWL